MTAFRSSTFPSISAPMSLAGSVPGASGMSATGAKRCRLAGSGRISSGTSVARTSLPTSVSLVSQQPPITSLAALRASEEKCRRCPLYKNATQVVPGEGPARARVMLVGEQPGDQEDRRGKPFVGPAGGVLERALEDAKID